MRLTKNLRFVKLLLKNGSLQNKAIDSKTSAQWLSVNTQQRNPAVALWLRLRTLMTRNVVIFNLWASVAYFKQALCKQATYLILDEQRLIFTRVPKAASTFLAYQLMKRIDPTLPPSLPDRQINELAPRYVTFSISTSKRNFTSFAVVRNPFHRIVATYREFVNPDATKKFIYENYLFGVLTRNMDFKEFIKVVELIPDFLKDGHFKPQAFILKEIKKKANVKVFRLEHDSEKLQVFLKKFDLFTPQQEQHSKSYDYRLYYDMETAERVRNIYVNDIKDFSYEAFWEDLVTSIKARATNP